MSHLNVDDLPKFGKEVRKRRESLKLTATEVAHRIGVSLSTYCNIEEARSLCSLPVYRNLCRTLRISPGKLIEPR